MGRRRRKSQVSCACTWCVSTGVVTGSVVLSRGTCRRCEGTSWRRWSRGSGSRRWPLLPATPRRLSRDGWQRGAARRGAYLLRGRRSGLRGSGIVGVVCRRRSCGSRRGPGLRCGEPWKWEFLPESSLRSPGTRARRWKGGSSRLGRLWSRRRGSGRSRRLGGGSAGGRLSTCRRTSVPSGLRRGSEGVRLSCRRTGFG